MPKNANLTVKFYFHIRYNLINTSHTKYNKIDKYNALICNDITPMI